MARTGFQLFCGIVTAVTVLFTQADAGAQYSPKPQPCPCQLASQLLAQLSDSLDLDNPNSARLKSEKTAFRYSLLSTLIPTATLVFAYPGLLIGPSTGYFYTGEGGRAWTGIGVRLLATGGMASAFVICGWDCGEGDSEYNIAWAVFLASGGAFVGSAIYDIATVERAVRRHNESLNFEWSAVPTYSARERRLGLRIGMRF